MPGICKQMLLGFLLKSLLSEVVLISFLSYLEGQIWASLMAQMIKNLPATQETWVQSLGWEDTLEKGMTAHSSFSCLENSMDRGAWRTTVYGPQKVRHG